MTACGCGGWALFMFNRIGLATAPRADEIAPAVTRTQTLPSIPYWQTMMSVSTLYLFPFSSYIQKTKHVFGS